MVEAEIKIYWIVRDLSDEVIGIMATSRSHYRGIKISNNTHNVEKISEAEFETYKEFDIPLYSLDDPEN